MNDITLYLHVGSGKTGTSSIQKFLSENRSELWKSCSCFYPRANKIDLHEGKLINHQIFFLNNDFDKQKEKILSSVKYCKSKSKNKMILSAELLFETEDARHLAEELTRLPGVNLQIIIYLRRQDHWLESAWKQWGYKSQKYSDIQDYVNKRDCSWLRRLQLWENAVGKERLIVRCYEKEQLSRGLIVDFLDAVGINYDGHTWTEHKDLLKGFQRDAMEILFLNKDFCVDENDNRLQYFLEEYLGESYQKGSFENYSFLSPQERLSIVERYADSNATVAKEFLGREDGRLFYEPFPDSNEKWEPYQGLTVEKIVPIFMQMLHNLDTKMNKRSHTKNILSKKSHFFNKIMNNRFIRSKNVYSYFQKRNRR